MQCTNDEWAIPAGARARRFFVLGVIRIEDTKYYTEGHAEIIHQSVTKATFCLYLFAPTGMMRGMQRDGRSFDHRTLETIRLMAVERVRAASSGHGHRLVGV